MSTAVNPLKVLQRHTELNMYDAMKGTIEKFFAVVATEPITYAGKTIYPKPLIVSSDIFRGTACPEMCGACCVRGTLDFLPGDPRPPEATQRFVEVNGKQIEIWSDMQDDNEERWCRHLNLANGRCGIHSEEYYPWLCDFALINVKHFKEKYWIGTTKFARTWNFRKITETDEEFKTRRAAHKPGALCSVEPFEPISEQTIANTRRKLRGLQKWVDHFQIPNRMKSIMAWANMDPIPTKSLYLGVKLEKGVF